MINLYLQVLCVKCCMKTSQSYRIFLLSSCILECYASTAALGGPVVSLGVWRRYTGW